MGTDHNTQEDKFIEFEQFYFIVTYLRQHGNYRALLEIDALVLCDDFSVDEKTAKLQTIIQGALNG